MSFYARTPSLKLLRSEKSRQSGCIYISELMELYLTNCTSQEISYLHLFSQLRIGVRSIPVFHFHSGTLDGTSFISFHCQAEKRVDMMNFCTQFWIRMLKNTEEIQQILKSRT